MRVLVAISILAFLALLWASVAIFRHIRRAQRRRRRAQEAARNNLVPIIPAAVIAPPPSAPVVPEITFNDPEAPAPEVTFTDTKAPFRETTPDSFQPYIRQAGVRTIEPRPLDPPPAVRAEYAPPAEVAAATIAEEFVDTLPPPAASSVVPRDTALSPLPYWPHFGFTPSSSSTQPTPKFESEDDLYAHPQLPPLARPEPIPYAGPAESSASVTPGRLPIVIPAPAPAVKPLYPSPYPSQLEPEALNAHVPYRPTHRPTQRADWSYFNKDMGDLSDPPPAGSRSRIPAYVPQTPIKPKSD